MGISTHEASTSVFSWIANNSALSYAVGSPLFIALITVVIFALLFYIWYDADDPFHSLFGVSVIVFVVQLIMLYSHNYHVENKLRKVIHEEKVIYDFDKITEGEKKYVNEKPSLDIINSSKPEEREDPFA